MTARLLHSPSGLLLALTLSLPGCAYHHAPGNALPPEIEPICFGFTSTCWYAWPEECGSCPSYTLHPDFSLPPPGGKSAEFPPTIDSGPPSVIVPKANVGYAGGYCPVQSVAYIPGQTPHYTSASHVSPRGTIRLPPDIEAE